MGHRFVETLKIDRVYYRIAILYRCNEAKDVIESCSFLVIQRGCMLRQEFVRDGIRKFKTLSSPCSRIRIAKCKLCDGREAGCPQGEKTIHPTGIHATTLRQSLKKSEIVRINRFCGRETVRFDGRGVVR